MLRLFVGGLSYDTTQEGLRQYFEHGFDVRDAIIMKDHLTGTSRGFGFVEIETDQTMEEVLGFYEDPRIDGRRVTINSAHPKPSRENGGAGNRRDDRRDDDRGQRGGGKREEYVSRRR